MQLTQKIATIDDQGKRFDNVARRAFPTLPLALINKAMRKGDLRLNQQKASGSERVNSGDVISYKGFFVDQQLPSPSARLSRPLAIIFENKHLLAINKDAGVLVHDGADSLEQQVGLYLGKSSSLSFRPGPCHRLDRNTSGLIIFAKSVLGARQFNEAMQSNTLHKIYLALLIGKLPHKILWQHQLARKNNVSYVSNDGQDAQTEVTPLAYGGGLSLVQCQLVTGRTHQIRAQAQASGYPLLGDAKYGGGGGGYFLHAHKLSSDGNKLFPPLTASLPKAFSAQLSKFSIAFDE